MLLTGHQSQSPREDLFRVIRQVRKRWRLRIVLRGLAVMVTAGIVAFLLSAYGLEYFRFSAPAIITFRILTYLTLTLLLVWSLLLPLSRRVSDESVALYLEEHEPSLQASVLSALEESGKPDVSSRVDMSPALIRRLIEVAVEKCDSIDFGRAVERRSLQRTSGALVGLAATSAMLLLFGPGYLRHGLSAVAFPHRSIETASPYKIVVAPGNVTIARGSDQVITAELVGFETEKVELYSRSHASVPYESLPLVTAFKENQYEVMLFDIGEATDYFVQSSGIRSEVYTIEVIDIPFVERLELEYHFPPYTELPPRTIEDGGDIAVLRGTEVRVRAVPTTETLGGRFVINEETILPMDRQSDGSLKTRFTVEMNGFYRIDLEDHDGVMITASSQHTIEVLDDQPPVVGFEKPGRDITASSIEEIFVEAKANDDFGIQALELVYAINGSDDKVLELFNNLENTPYDTSAGYTFFLEEYGLEPGDLISYYARARDSANGDKSNVGTSDLYFIQIRPFGKDFLPAESQAGMGGGGGGGATSPDALSQQQREIVSATFNIVRDRSKYSDEEFRENVVFLALAQGKLREEVQTLLGRLNSRVVNVDPAFVEISEILPQAVTSMQRAEETLQTQNAKDALPPEQHALRMLQRAEATYEEVRVAMESQGGGGGGSGGRQSAAEDLADLFELELDKLQNQYETLQSAQQQLADTKLDETLERLKELARRQEQEAERQRLRARGQRTASSGSGASQRALADETEEAARQLERLARNESDPDLMQAAQQLQKAADAMRRAAVDPGDNGMADASTALEQLREAQSRLEQEQSGRLKRNIATALDRVDALAEAERQVTNDVTQLDQDPQVRRTQVGPLMGRKDQMSTEVASLERQLDNTSAEFRRDEREASQRLQTAADSIRKNKLKEKIRYSKGVILGRAPEYSRAFEQQIGADIEEIRQALSEAEAAIGQNPADQWAEALEATRDLMRGVQSLEQRVGEAARRDGAAQDEQQRQSQGDLQQGGQSGQGQRSGGNRTGVPNQGGNRTHAQPSDWNVGPDQVRQFSREYREQAMDAQKLRQLLEQQGVTVDDLDAVIQALREFDDQRIYADADEIARLQTFVNENLKRFEYRLRRENEGEDTNPLFLAGSDEVPSGFRDLIEEYFRRLSQEEPSS
ncbi:MAG: DUF4175 family protein [Acidobacteriota bacterium]|nr:DUF4175 family protein [Acidobacteriota bacterium]